MTDDDKIEVLCRQLMVLTGIMHFLYDEYGDKIEPFFRKKMDEQIKQSGYVVEACWGKGRMNQDIFTAIKNTDLPKKMGESAQAVFTKMKMITHKLNKGEDISAKEKDYFDKVKKAITEENRGWG